MTITPAQCRAARALIGMDQRTLAAAAVLGVHVIDAFERESVTLPDADLAAIRSALEAVGVEFIAENGGGVGVRLRKNNVVRPTWSKPPRPSD